MPRYYRDRIFPIGGEHRGKIKQHFQVKYGMPEQRPDFIKIIAAFQALGHQTLERIKFANAYYDDATKYIL